MKISAVIITLNEAHNIGRCLRSLDGVVDECVVVDSGSEDDTVALASAFPWVRVITKEWMGFATQKNWANEQAVHRSILSMDADEALSGDLQKSILEWKQSGSANEALQFNRLTRYCGHWVRHGGWYPDRKIRLFPGDKAHWEGAYVHESLVLDQDVQVRQMAGNLLHYSINSREEHLETIRRYARLKAEEMLAKGKQAGPLKGIASAISRWASMYILKGGWLDGIAGWHICRLSAYAAWLKYRYLRELQQSTEH